MNDELSSLERRARVHAALGDPVRLTIVDMLSLSDTSPGEVAHRLGLPTNLIAHHIKVLHSAGVLLRTQSEGDRRRTYLRLLPTTLDALRPPALPAAPRVVFVCTRNSARSPLAAALWAQRTRIPSASAGTEPADRVHPLAVRVARRHGLILDNTGTAHIADVVRDDDLVIAVCDSAHEHLGALSRQLHWSVPDPAPADTDEAFDAAFAEIAVRIERLATALTREFLHD